MKIDVLENGFIELIDRMGNDYSVIRSARVSTGKNIEVINVEKDRKLIRYLYKNEHHTPFEQVVFTFHVKCPLFVARQWFRSRTQSYNEASGRYKKFEWECFSPSEWRLQDTKNKQNSIEIENQAQFSAINKMVNHIFSDIEYCYNVAIDKGVANELARIVMPLAQYTEFYTTLNLRNLLHFLELRLHKHAQKEIREYAEAILKILLSLDDLKWTMEIFEENRKLKYTIQEKIGLEDGLGNFTRYVEEFKK